MCFDDGDDGVYVYTCNCLGLCMNEMELCSPINSTKRNEQKSIENLKASELLKRPNGQTLSRFYWKSIAEFSPRAEESVLGARLRAAEIAPTTALHPSLMRGGFKESQPPMVCFVRAADRYACSIDWTHAAAGRLNERLEARAGRHPWLASGLLGLLSLPPTQGLSRSLNAELRPLSLASTTAHRQTELTHSTPHHTTIHSSARGRPRSQRRTIRGGRAGCY